MATVVMRWLETRPADYDRGINLLTLGQLPDIKERIAAHYLPASKEDTIKVLEIGCGTGSLSIRIAQQGAEVTAIDNSPDMLQIARARAADEGLQDGINFIQMDATEIGDHFKEESFDLAVSTLVFSELRPEVRLYVLKELNKLLRKEGRLLIADEVAPAGFLGSALYWMVRLPLVVFTWLLTRTTTRPLGSYRQMLDQARFKTSTLESHLFGSLLLIGATPSAGLESAAESVQPETYPRLRHRTTLKTITLDLLSLFYRIIPPYPKFDTGLYQIGHPDRGSPVLVTGNYELTVRRLVKALDGSVDCWLVVADSGGINVWCSAGGGHFTADDVIAALRTSGVDSMVDHHALILPQLCANGVDGWRIRESTKWGVHWGPVHASDIPAYLFSGRKKNDVQRHVSFPLKDRLEMTTVMLGLYTLILLIPFLIFWRAEAVSLLVITALIGYFLGIFMPWIPGRDGLEKGISLAVLVVIGLWTWSLGWGYLSPDALFSRSLGLGFLAFFIGSEFQGMSPKLRGEQANWTIEGVAGLITLALYFAGRTAFGVIS